MTHLLRIALLFLFIGNAYSDDSVIINDKPAVELPGPLENDDPTELERLLAEEEGSGSREHFFNEFLNMMVMLGFVLGGMVILAWIAKRFLNVRMQQVNAQSAIRIEERRSLGPKSMLYLVEIEGHRVLIGETPAGLVRLGQLHESSEQRARAASSKFTRMMEVPPNTSAQ